MQKKSRSCKVWAQQRSLFHSRTTRTAGRRRCARPAPASICVRSEARSPGHDPIPTRCPAQLCRAPPGPRNLRFVFRSVGLVLALLLLVAGWRGLAHGGWLPFRQHFSLPFYFFPLGVYPFLLSGRKRVENHEADNYRYILICLQCLFLTGE